MKSLFCLIALATLANACGRYDEVTGDLKDYGKVKVHNTVCKATVDTVCPKKD